MNNESRLQYYLGKLYYENKIYIKKNEYSNYVNSKDDIPKEKIIKINKKTLEKSKILPSYKEILKLLNCNNDFLYCYGDIIDNINTFCFVKNRFNNISNSIILKSMNSSRHWNKNIFNTVLLDNNNKILKCCWIGATTGIKNFDRYILVEKFFNNSNYNVGFSQIVQGRKQGNKYLKNKLTIEEQLKYKFLLSIEGNDVATDLKWKLMSKSIVLMKKPTRFSWLMEDKLIPNFHYILLKNDFSDLDEKINWCINNLNKVNQIIKNANDYMTMFLDEQNEQKLEKIIISTYFTKIIFEENL